MDHEAFQKDSQTTLIAVCFVSLRPLLLVLRQTSEEHFQEQKGTHIAAVYLALRHTGNWVLFPSFYPSTIWSLHPSTVPNVLSLLKLSYFNWIVNPIHVVFPCLRWVLGADRISSTPKCFLFLPLFIFFPFLIGLCLSIWTPTHALCHVL